MTDALADKLIDGDRAALARGITLVESTRADHQARARELLTAVMDRTGKAWRIGLTGVPGVGKSTLIDALRGQDTLRAGERVCGEPLAIGYFAQHQAEELNPANDVLTEVEEVLSDNPDANPRGALGALLFSGNDELVLLASAGKTIINQAVA